MRSGGWAQVDGWMMVLGFRLLSQCKQVCSARARTRFPPEPREDAMRPVFSGIFFES